jgi:hypothetical protein
MGVTTLPRRSLNPEFDQLEKPPRSHDKCTCRGYTAGWGSAGSGVIKRKSDGSAVNNNEDDLPQSMDCRVEYVITFWCLPGKVEGNACVPILNRIIVCEPSDTV